MSKNQVHWSHISMYSRCGEAYRRRYIEGEIIPPGIALHVGIGTHKSVEKNAGTKIATGKYLPLEAVKEAARDAVNKSWDESGVTLDDEEKTTGVKILRGDAVDMAVSLSGLHAEAVAPKIEPAFTERRFVLELPGFPVDLAGAIDLQETVERQRTIRDTKTRKASPPATLADESDQLTMYALAARTLDGAIPPLALDALVKTKTPKAVTLMTTRTDDDLQVLLRRVEAHVNAVKNGVFIPAAQDSFWCSRKFCGFASSCKFFRGSKQI